MAQDMLAERYGAPSPWRRRALVVGSVLVAAVFLGWVTWTALAHGDPEVSSDLVTYEVDGEHRATARIHVELGDDGVATCLLRATAEDHTIVGELSFEVDRSDLSDAGTLERAVRTERRATTVELMGCTAPGQSRPR